MVTISLLDDLPIAPKLYGREGGAPDTATPDRLPARRSDSLDRAFYPGSSRNGLRASA